MSKTVLLASAVVALALFSGGEANAFLAGKNTPGQPQGAYTPQNSNSGGGKSNPWWDPGGRLAPYERGAGGGYCGACGPTPTQQQTRY